MSVKNLCLGYNESILTEDLSFEVNAGDYICIIGENGAGKSTLIRTLLGLQAPISGHISTDEGLKKNEIGYLPQQTTVQKDFPATVEEIVLSGFQAKKGLRPFYNSREKNEMKKILERLNISGFLKRSYRKLSGGQQQRVLLARALCASDRLIVLDEPVSGLDPKASEDMYEIISRLNFEGVAVIMISHDVNAALKYSSHILHMRKKALYLPKQEYLKTDLCRIYTG